MGLTQDEWAILWLSAKVAVAATLLCLPVGVAAGWLLARRQFMGKSLVEALLLLPMVLPPTVPGYVLLVLFSPEGALGRGLAQLGIELAFNWKGAVLAAAVIAFPLMVQSAKLAVQSIDRRLEQASATLGASPWRVWWSVTLPLMIPGILIGVILVFCRALGEFGATMTFVGNIAGETRTLPLAIYSATHQLDGDATAWRLIGLCIALSFAALLIAHALQRKAQRLVGSNER
jgi:molybdate transport system permease protein